MHSATHQLLDLGLQPLRNPPSIGSSASKVTNSENLNGLVRKPFREGAYADTQSKFAAGGGRLTSRANGRSWSVGAFEMASLAELRRREQLAGAPNGKP
jgi:hypothetical protein